MQPSITILVKTYILRCTSCLDVHERNNYPFNYTCLQYPPPLRQWLRHNHALAALREIVLQKTSQVDHIHQPVAEHDDDGESITCVAQSAVFHFCGLCRPSSKGVVCGVQNGVANSFQLPPCAGDRVEDEYVCIWIIPLAVSVVVLTNHDDCIQHSDFPDTVHLSSHRLGVPSYLHGLCVDSIYRCLAPFLDRVETAICLIDGHEESMLVQRCSAQWI